MHICVLNETRHQNYPKLIIYTVYANCNAAEILFHLSFQPYQNIGFKLKIVFIISKTCSAWYILKNQFSSIFKKQRSKIFRIYYMLKNKIMLKKGNSTRQMPCWISFGIVIQIMILFLYNLKVLFLLENTENTNMYMYLIAFNCCFK